MEDKNNFELYQQLKEWIDTLHSCGSRTRSRSCPSSGTKLNGKHRTHSPLHLWNLLNQVGSHFNYILVSDQHGGTTELEAEMQWAQNSQSTVSVYLLIYRLLNSWISSPNPDTFWFEEWKNRVQVEHSPNLNTFVSNLLTDFDNYQVWDTEAEEDYPKIIKEQEHTIQQLCTLVDQLVLDKSSSDFEERGRKLCDRSK